MNEQIYITEAADKNGLNKSNINSPLSGKKD